MHQAARQDPLGVALVLASAACFGCLAVLAKLAYRSGLDVSTLLVVRFVVAAAVLWASLAVRGVRAAPRRPLGAGLLLGAAIYAAQAGLLFGALHRLDASLASVLFYVYPALIVLTQVTLGRERATGRGALLLAMALGGTALALLGRGIGHADGLGAVMALGSAAAYTAYVLGGDRLLTGLEPRLLTALVTTGGATTFLVAAVAGGGPHLGFERLGWLWALGVALISTVLSITLLFAGIARVGPSTAGLLSTVEPVVTIALAYAVFGERLRPLQLVGAALVLAAVVGLQRRPREAGG